MKNANESTFPLNEALLFSRTLDSLTDYIYNLLSPKHPKIFFTALMVLESDGPMPISKLGERLFITKSNMTSIIEKLKENGLVDINQSLEDKRIKIISLSAIGAERFKFYLLKINEVMEIQFASLTTEERTDAALAIKTITRLSKKIMQ